MNKSLAVCVLFFCAGCAGLHSDSNSGQMESYPAPSVEAAWIRNGEPLVYEGQQWFPVRDTESLMDTDVYHIGDYKGVQVFVEKTDLKPYERLYTKFGRGKYRYFERPND